MIRLCAAVLCLTLAGAADAREQAKPIKVFILAGQSNMEGKAKVSLLTSQLGQPAMRGRLQYLRPQGQWLKRDDVWIKFFERKGSLTVGYGSPGCIGPELGFGIVVGDHYGEQVLLIKTAWGGKSLYRDFRPPSAGLPPTKVLEHMLAERQKHQPEATLEDVKATFGASYRAMLGEIRSTLRNLQTNFPSYAGQGYELAGFVWFQGWNDMIRPDYTVEYTQNLVHFIKDVRRDLKSPRLPFVIGQMGVDGTRPSATIARFKSAEAAVLQQPLFQGNVALVRTDVFWDREADAVFRKGWRTHQAEWDRVGSDYPYHYLGSVKTMLAMGRAFGEAMVDLCAQGATSDDKATVAKELKKLRGVCTFVSVEAGGKQAPAEQFKELTITFAGGKYTVKKGDEVIQVGTQKLDPSKSPKTMDVKIIAGLNKGAVMLGIYEIKGDILRVCFDEGGKKRPTEFKSAAGSETFVNVHKRIKK